MRMLDPLNTLTRREREVLWAMVEGKTCKQMAIEQFVSLTTARSQIRSVLFKLRVRSQLEAVAYVNARLIPEDERLSARERLLQGVA